MNNLGFWKKLKRPILALAPMADLTDSPFRQIVASKGRPDVFFNEFVSADGLCLNGKDSLLPLLRFGKVEHPIVAQLFGSKPENFYQAARIIVQLGFDGIDINMGCPFKKIEKQGAGAALIENPKLAQMIILETKRGAKKIPVSVKTRIGYHREIVREWIPEILKADPAVITIHGRTRNEKSKVGTHWEVIGKAAKIVRKSGKRSLIIGNGDINSLEEAKTKAKKYNLDGIMIGRAIWKNPWFFAAKNVNSVPITERIATLVEHAKIYESFHRNKKNFHDLRKFYSSYISSFKGAKRLRMKMMTAENSEEVEKIAAHFFREDGVSF